MSTRYIKIETCASCPHRNHQGAFATTAYVPVCRKTNKCLPFNEAYQNGRLYADPTFTIPKWCPLEVYPQQEVS
jgi:hypothetical protein